MKRPSLLELWADMLLIFSGLMFALIFSMIAWRGYYIWEHRPLAIFEAIVAFLIVILGVERFIHDWHGH